MSKRRSDVEVEKVVKRRRVAPVWSTPPSEEVLEPPWAAFVPGLCADVTRLVGDYLGPPASERKKQYLKDIISRTGCYDSHSGGACPSVHKKRLGCRQWFCTACQDPDNPDCRGDCLV
jgi:hypothetical protein